MNDDHWFKLFVIIFIIGFFTYFFAESKVHQQRVELCMEAGHDRLWCEGLLR